VYLAGLIQGLALVTFPAASSILTSPRVYGLSETQYGAMFLPQVALAIVASAAAPALARRWGLKRVFLLGLGANLASMMLLAGSRLLVSSPAVAYGALLVATGVLGGGFGVTVMTLNTFAQEYFPAAADRAVLAMNVLLGVGTTLGPALVAVFLALGAWWLLPILTAAALLCLLDISLQASLTPHPRPTADAGGPARSPERRAGRLPRRFWLYAGAVLLYGVIETLCGNWSTLYLIRERHVPTPSASLALTIFWAMMTLGRVGAAFLSTRIAARWIYLVHPVVMLVALLVVSRATTTAGGIAAFGLAGLACSAFLPLSISLGGQAFSDLTAVVSGQLIAFYQIGYGIAAFGVGPLRMATGASLSTIYAGAAAAAAALAVLAVRITVRPPDGRWRRRPSPIVRHPQTSDRRDAASNAPDPPRRPA